MIDHSESNIPESRDINLFNISSGASVNNLGHRGSTDQKDC